MSYEEIAQNELYTTEEKENIRKILEELSTRNISEESKNKYMENLKHILNDMSSFTQNSKDKTIDNVARSYYDRRLGTLLDTIKNEPDLIQQRKKVERKIENFMDTCGKLDKELNEVQRRLILSNDVDLNMTEAIMGIDSQLEELIAQAEDLKNEIDEFRKLYHNADFSMSVPEMQKIVDDFKTRVKEIKAKQIEQYNSRVQATNRKIRELKSMSNLSPEILALINGLEELSECKVKTVKWNSKKYYNSIDYKKLIERNAQIANIENQLGIAPNPTASYDDDLNSIENEIDEIDSKVKENLSVDELNALKDDANLIGNRINDLSIRVINDSSLATSVRNGYLEKITDVQLKLEDLKEKLDKELSNINNSDYRRLMQEIEDIEKNVAYWDNVICSVVGEIGNDVLISMHNELDKLKKQLDDVENEINECHSNGKIDDVQFENLNNRLKEVREHLDEVNGKLKNPEMVKDKDVFDVLNGDIDGLSAAIIALESQVDSLEKPIKDKETRKKIESEIERLEKEIKTIRDYLEKHKDDDPEKYDAASKRLDEEQKKLDEVSKKYRKKCPFLVRSVKSAKDFYKKHKKLALIIAGLAAVALIHATLGPVIIPAIMHGNLMIMHCAPALRGAIGAINKVLGNAIHASVINNVWTLANGVTIAPYCATSSLLKGIAISGMGTAAIVTPLVLGVKQLVNKMNNSKLKQETTEKLESSNGEKKEQKDGLRKKAKETADKVKEKMKKNTGENGSKNENKQRKEFLNEISRLLKEYQKSNLSFEEFCEQNNVPVEYRAMLENYDNKVRGR